MRFLRLVLVGLMALAAMAGALFVAIVIFFTGMVAGVMRLFGRKETRPPRGPGPQPRAPARTDEVIDVVATRVPDDSPPR